MVRLGLSGGFDACPQRVNVIVLMWWCVLCFDEGEMRGRSYLLKHSVKNGTPRLDLDLALYLPVLGDAKLSAGAK